MITDPEARARQNIPGLREFDKRLARIGEEIVNGLRHSQDDDLGFMAGVFLCKQLDHMVSALTLERSRDGSLIARSMLEGAWQLAWASNDSPNRPRQWREFAAVEKWRAMQRDRCRGKEIPAGIVLAVEKQVRDHGRGFRRSGGKKSRRTIGHVDDPYYDTWRKGVSMRTMAQEAGDILGHDVVYTDFSDWHHWGAAGVAYALAFQGDSIRYRGARWSEQAVALAAAFSALWTTCHLVDLHFGLRHDLPLQALQKEYLEWNAGHGVT